MKKIIIPSEIVQSEFTIKKSQFISIIYPILEATEVKIILKELREAHPQARHVVWAYIEGDAGTMYGMSDDGEPHGTAGRPVLEVLKGSGITNIALFVIRNFGGIKLGTGGLVQAYTQAAQDVVALCETKEKVDKETVYLTVPYSQYEVIKKIIEAHEGEIVSEDFASDIDFEVSITSRSLEACRLEITEISSGRVELISLDE